jgi:hypothetical protein
VGESPWRFKSSHPHSARDQRFSLDSRFFGARYAPKPSAALMGFDPTFFSLGRLSYVVENYATSKETEVEVEVALHDGENFLVAIGNPPGTRGLPTRVVVAGNTILSGSPRDPERFRYWPGVSNSVIVSEGFEAVPLELRPLIVNNLIGRTSHPDLLCPHSWASGYNHLTDGAPCSELDSTGDPLTDETGFPSEGSPLRGRADRSWSTASDFTGRMRDEAPDIGAFEWRP